VRLLRRIHPDAGTFAIRDRFRKCSLLYDVRTGTLRYIILSLLYQCNDLLDLCVPPDQEWQSSCDHD
jgi:hypothetical protein